MRIPPFCLVAKSRVLHTCVYVYGGIQEGEGPVVLTILLFKKYCRQYTCMEMETLLVFLSGIFTKKVSTSATLIKDSKVKLSS